MVTFSELGQPQWGRLGNQLFIIASTLGIAHQNNQKVVLPAWQYASYFANHLPLGSLTQARIYHQSGFTYKPVILPTGDWDLRGNFQSEKFFRTIAAEVRQQFTPAPDLEQYILHKYGQVLANGPVSIHVRRGDYIRQSVAFPTQSPAYYHHAVQQFSADTSFLVFSDDITWCRRQFTGPKFQFVDGEKDIVDLFLMSRCRSHIISNSSFSWWGAWLNPNPDKVVLCPTRWFGPAVTGNPARYTRDLLAEGFRALPMPNENPALTKLYYSIAYPIYATGFETLKLGVRFLRALGLYRTGHSI